MMNINIKTHLSKILFGCSTLLTCSLTYALPDESNCKTLQDDAFQTGLLQDKSVSKSLVISESNWLVAGKSRVGRDIVDIPAHCQVIGFVDKRTSPVDGKTYQIGFELRLPADWNQRFLFQDNGGSDGQVVAAYGGFPNQSVPALAQGFAVISSDAGHQNDNSSLIAGALFGHDPQARLDYGYNANQVLTPLAKNIIQTYYGQPPNYSYFMGCSNGGRHAMVAASRMASQFDGFIAGNPGFNLPKAALQHAWDIQSLSTLNNDITKTLSVEGMALLSNAVLSQCDALDGLTDGMVFSLNQCQKVFDPKTLTCTAEANSSCLSADKVRVISRMFSGPVNSKGQPLYADWSYDAGISGADWRRWKIQSPIANLPIIAALGSGTLAKVFMTPPMELSPAPAGLVQFLRGFDFDKDAPAIFATSDTYPVSPMDFMTPPDVAVLTSLAASGSKLMVTHGSSDGVFSVNDTINWYDKLTKNHQGKANEFARLFVVPGMNHCAGGPTTDKFDALGAMVNWVEKNVAPESITASVNANNPELPADWSKERTRLLCNYPQTAVYKSGGDSESASNFQCK